MAKHKYIETPEKMWELFTAYEKEVKDNPILKNNFAGKDAYEVQLKLERPLTMEGFECYVFELGLNSDLSHYFSNYEGRYTDYLAVCSHIKRKIRKDQIEGGMAGIYNPSITQRLNGLVEKSETTIKEEQPLFPDVSKDNSENQKQ
jgi:hypothetical protein